jgi:signal transduction histidine kinase
MADADLTFYRERGGDYRRTVLGVPLTRQGATVGSVILTRAKVAPFTDKQIRLVETFADQAVIAIENTRLFEAEQARTRELTEALEQQSATSEVLGVISRSKFDLQPVFETIAENAVKLSQAERAFIFRFDGSLLRAVASYNVGPELREFVGRNPISPGRYSASARAALERRTVHIPDVQSDPEFTYAARDVDLVRTLLAVPLLRGGDLLGTITIYKLEVKPFTENQIALLETFADQAVIAIENTGLFEEVQARTRELAKTVEELEIASQHKSQFVAHMSHELRTPLAAILGYAELMQEGFYEPQGRRSLDALTRIRSNGKHLLSLINTVLDIAKIESGQFTLNMAEYAIESVIETVRSATESLAQNKKLALKTEVAKSLPIGFGDEQRLTQVLLNLVGNAIKFADLGEVRLTARAVNGHFAVSVADTGPGIPEHEQTRIFDQFHQVDSSLTRAKGGTGLGLAIVKQIVEMHGGRIWVESTLGKGSTFHMELPTRAEFQKRAP